MVASQMIVSEKLFLCLFSTLVEQCGLNFFGDELLAEEEADQECFLFRSVLAGGNDTAAGDYLFFLWSGIGSAVSLWLIISKVA